nr:MAG TPA: hypothetical protein [Caudoviricetes sp.]
MVLLLQEIMFLLSLLMVSFKLKVLVKVIINMFLLLQMRLKSINLLPTILLLD